MAELHANPSFSLALLSPSTLASACFSLPADSRKHSCTEEALVS